MMRRLEAGDKVSNICRDFKVSRDIFYKWLKRYQEAQDLVKREALESLRPKGERHWRYIPEAKNLVLKVVLEHPEFSVHKISKVLFQQENKHILSSFGVHTLLSRLNLNTYQRRLSYAKSQGEGIGVPTRQAERGWMVPIFGKIPSLSALAPPLLSLIGFGGRAASFFKKVISSKFFLPLALIILLGFASSVVLSNLSFGQEIVSKIGTLLSFLALFLGMFFFIYSLKYYLTIAIVLSFSRKKEDKEDRGSRGAGLKSDLSKITLQRHPFVSIHIATYNETLVVGRLLKSITSFAYDNYEVVIVDDSNDDTTLIIADYINIKYQR